MNRTELLNALQRYDACEDSTKWIMTRPLDQSPCELWHTSERGDWLLWIAAKAGVKHETQVMAACQCARLTLNLVPDGETCPLRCIEITEAWTRGEATIEQVCEAQRAVNTNAYTTATAAANAAVRAAARVACVAYAADVVDAVYVAVRAAARAACTTSDAAARAKMRQRCAVAVRGVISFEAVEAAILAQVTS